MSDTTSVLIIGAGFAGLGTAIQLLKRGIDDFVILERAGEVGGTWRDNSYPGAACDIPSLLYSYSFEPNPDWSRAYSGSSEYSPTSRPWSTSTRWRASSVSTST